MDQGPLNNQIVTTFGTMSAQLQAAARYVLDRPKDVALLSMREQARQAGVQPATMTRLAKHLGLSGYDDLREMYAAAVRNGELGFAGRANAQVSSQKLKGDKALAAEILGSVGRQIDGLTRPETLDSIVASAKALAGARRIYCLGLRSSHSVAWQLHYVLGLIGERTVHLEGNGATGADALAAATDHDVLLIVTVLPYTRLAVELAEYAVKLGLPIVGITDSVVSPVAQIADHTIIVPTDSPSFFHTMSPAFAVAEALAAIVAGRGGRDALTAIRRKDEHLAALQTHIEAARLKRTD
jgi:DNA-binding MurR/RpiR family transcriptional regulator